MAQPSLTKIEDSIFLADGSRLNGIALIEWRSFLASDFTSVSAYNRTLRVIDGVLRVSLVPTTTASAGAYYYVRFLINGRVQSTQYWAVPPSTPALRIKDIQLAGPPPGGSVISPPGNDGPVQITDVVGLTDELNARAKKGLEYAPSRVAVINPSGDLDAAAGEPTDCVRANGTTGPCDVSGGGPTFADAEEPVGLVNGSNTVFTLSNPPAPETSLQVYRNGVLQKAGYDYTLSGSTITFASGAIPQTGDLLIASYRLGTSGQPGGQAGGALTGYFPSPSVAPGAISDLHVATNAAIAESKLALNFPTHTAANDPSTEQKAALNGSVGTPSNANRYVTDQDPRLTNSRTPSAHALLGGAHFDANPAVVARGDLIVGQGTTPALWSRLPIGAANRCLTSNGFDAVWNACLFTGYPAGSVPFVDGSGGLAHNNSRLFWDNSYRRLGIGMNAPTGTLSVHDSAVGTGSTSVDVRAGDGQGTAPLQRWQDSGGVDVARLEADGVLMARSVKAASSSSRAAWQETGSAGDPTSPADGHLWYNTTDQTRRTMEANQRHTLPQVVCSTSGTTTNALTATSIGKCRIPALLIRSGDRFEISFDISHEGGGTGFSYTLYWGSTVLAARSAAGTEGQAAGRSEAVPQGSDLYWTSRLWGSSASLMTSASSASSLPAGEVVVDVVGQMASTTSETITLRSLSVVRLPSQVNP